LQKPGLPWSPSLTMSIPAVACRATTPLTAAATSGDDLISSARSGVQVDSTSSSSAFLGRLPVWVVRIRSMLRCMTLPHLAPSQDRHRAELGTYQASYQGTRSTE